jgi:hypothetical protein
MNKTYKLIKEKQRKILRGRGRKGSRERRKNNDRKE